MDIQAPPPALTSVYAPVGREMELLGQFLGAEFAGVDSVIAHIIAHVERFRGKQMRPALLFLARQLGRNAGAKARANASAEDAVKIGAVIELIHTATLVHDDILDAALMRRQVETVHRRWGERAAVLIGDFIYSRAFHLSTQVDGMAGVLSETTNTICEGELLQLRNRFCPDLGEQRYFEIIEKKTAILYAVACRLGGVLGGLDAEGCDALWRYGMDLGMAFQIVDDCLDYAGKEADAGKSLGTDLRQNKVTLPLIYLLDGLGRRDAARLRSQLSQPLSPEEEQWIHKLVSERGVVADALRRADGFVQSARQALRRIPAAGTGAVAAQESLEIVGDYVLRRQR